MMNIYCEHFHVSMHTIHSDFIYLVKNILVKLLKFSLKMGGQKFDNPIECE